MAPRAEIEKKNFRRKVVAAPCVRSETQKENADSSFNLLGFLSVAGVLVLAIRKIPGLPGVRSASPRDHALGISIEEKITIL